MERNNIMKFLLRHFYNISIFIGIITILLTIVFWQDLVVLQRLALLNLAILNFHFFEEFGFQVAFLNLQIQCLHTKIVLDQRDFH